MTSKVTLHCEQCGKAYLKHRCYAERSRFCSRLCANTWISRQQTIKATETRICPVCDSKFETTNHHGGRKTCSNKCASAIRNPALIEAGKERSRKTPREIKSCPNCQKEFSVTPARKNKIYCDRKCHKQHKEKTGKVVKPCASCGKDTGFYPSQIALRNGRYCSVECQRTGMSEGMKGSNNPNWVGGAITAEQRGPNWGRQKRKARRRDNYTCKRCGDELGRRNRKLHVHHIIPFRLYGDDYKSANRLENLVCLCHGCHSSVESSVRDYLRSIGTIPLFLNELLAPLKELI